MSRIRVSDAARSDLEGIWLFIAADNPADKLVAALVSRFPKLSVIPGLGRERKELAAGLRSFPVSNYVIFYRVFDDGVEIVRVLHGARDLPPLLPPPEA